MASDKKPLWYDVLMIIFLVGCFAMGCKCTSEVATTIFQSGCKKSVMLETPNVDDSK